jgi:hypothetical protein
MPNISASEYTTFLKYQAAQQSYSNGRPPRMIQTVDQASPNITILNANLKTSQAAFATKPAFTALASNLNYVRPTPPNRVNNPNALSTVSTGTLSSSFTRLR